MSSLLGLGVDGGGSKTALVLVDENGRAIARHQAAGCNPNLVGREAAGTLLHQAMADLRAAGPTGAPIAHTLLCMAGNRLFWREFGAGLPPADFGRVQVTDDSRPVLELATARRAGLVLHGGTGSFVAALTAPGDLTEPRVGAVADPFLPGWHSHYADGTGWRLGDVGSGHDLGRRACRQALLELQGWLPPSRLAPALLAATGATDAETLTRHLYQHADPNTWLAGLAPLVLGLAEQGDPAAEGVATDSARDLGDLAQAVMTRLWPARPADQLALGLSGPVLGHPAMRRALREAGLGRAERVEAAPIEGVAQLLQRLFNA
jgi:glucosamine kinase